MKVNRQHTPFCWGLWGLALAIVAGTSAYAQQSYVSRYDFYAGFADVESPALGLNQTGFHLQAGINPRPWYSLGADYTNARGSMVLTPNELPSAAQTQLLNEIAELEALHILPPNYALRVPTDAYLQSFAMGPQFNYRHFSRVTLFTHPSLGAFRESAYPHGQDDFALGVVSALTHNTGIKIDWTGFYGGAAGAEFNLTKHIGARAMVDMIYQHPFNDILANGFWTERYSVGLAYHFGPNILGAKKHK
jgi:hypothetical protein